MITVKKAWGEELWIENNDRYCGKRLSIREGWQSSLHRHLVKDETLYVQRGSVRFELGDDVMPLGPGMAVRVRPGQWHRFSALEDSVMFEFSTTHDDADVERMSPSRELVTESGVRVMK